MNLREYRATTAPALQRDLVLQAIQELEGVAAQTKALAEPFGSLLSLMVERWRPVLSEEGGRTRSVRHGADPAHPQWLAGPRAPLGATPVASLSSFLLG